MTNGDEFFDGMDRENIKREYLSLEHRYLQIINALAGGKFGHDYPVGYRVAWALLLKSAAFDGENYRMAPLTDQRLSDLASALDLSEADLPLHLAQLEQDGIIRREERPGRRTIFYVAEALQETPAPTLATGGVS